MTVAFVLSGRRAAADKILSHLRRGTQTFSVKAESPEESLAILTAAIVDLPEPERSTYLSRIIVVRTTSAWDRLVVSTLQLILIPLFDDIEAVSRAVRLGHRVAVPVGASHPETETTVVVPRLSATEATKNLIQSGVPEDKAHELGILARRSLTALRRKLSIRPEAHRPAWARPENVAVLLPLLLAGSWNGQNSSDLALLGELAQADPFRVQETALRWSKEVDPPLRYTGNVWYVTSRGDAWDLAAPALTHTHLERLEGAVLTVFGTPDPRLDIPKDRRWFSSERLRHSGHLRQGLAETLAIMGARGAGEVPGGLDIEQWAARIVGELLRRANADWRIWASMSSELSTLAEAAPGIFLTAVEQGLNGNQPLIKLFEEEGDSLFYSSPHTGLLWALERLAWSSEHLSRTVVLLGKLARLDPGGNVRNRPRESLRETFLMWRPQTNAPWDRQLQVLKMLLDRESAAGWQLHADLLPRFHDFAASRTKPEWRDWAPESEPTLSIAEHIRRIRDLVSQMLAVVGTSGPRWADLITASPQMPVDVQDQITGRLSALKSDDLTPDDRAEIWRSLRKVVADHRSFPDAAWALPVDRIDTFDSLFNQFEPDDLFSRFGWLFGDRVTLPAGQKRDWREEEDSIADARRVAIQAIHARADVDGIELFINRVENPFFLGRAFGASGSGEAKEDEILRKYLASDDSAGLQFARGFVLGRGGIKGRLWSEEKFSLAGLSAVQRAHLLAMLLTDRKVWELASFDPVVNEAYWKLRPLFFNGSAEDVDYAARQLIKYECAFSAAELLAFHLTQPKPPSSVLIADTLEAALAQESVDTSSGSLLYRVGQLLDALGSRGDIEQTRVATIEWGFTPLLLHDRPPCVLHHELARSPTFFAELIGLSYLPENRDRKEPSKSDPDRAMAAYHVIHSWKSIPGQSQTGEVDQVTLSAWVDESLKLATEMGRPTVAAQEIGKVLSHGPTGTDGAWPHEAVRDVIESCENREIEKGFDIGTFNSRGVVSRSLTEGGGQERFLAEQYARWGTQIRDRWPRTAAVLSRIEQTYQDEARREDAEADLRKDGIW